MCIKSLEPAKAWFGLLHAVLHEIHACGLQILWTRFEGFDEVFVIASSWPALSLIEGFHHFKERHHVLAAVLRQFAAHKV